MVEVEVYMKIIKIKTSIINAAAESAGMTAEDFVSKIRSLSVGREVCAHFKKNDGAYSVFICT